MIKIAKSLNLNNFQSRLENITPIPRNRTPKTIKKLSKLLNSLIPIRTDPRPLVIFIAVHIRRVIKGPVPPPHGSPPPLIGEVPVEAEEGAVEEALVEGEELTLLHSKLLQVSANCKQIGVEF